MGQKVKIPQKFFKYMKLVITMEGDDTAAKMASFVAKNTFPANRVQVSVKSTKLAKDKIESTERKNVLQRTFTDKELTFPKISNVNKYTSRKALTKLDT